MSIEALYPPLIGPSLTLIYLFIVTSVTKSPKKVKNLFPLRLAPRSNAFRSEKTWGFHFGKLANSKWCWVEYRAYLSGLNAKKRPVPDRTSTACFIRSHRFSLQSWLLCGCALLNANFHQKYQFSWIFRVLYMNFYLSCT